MSAPDLPPETEAATGTATANTGSLKRAVVLLKLIAGAGARGLALTEISSRTGLAHATVHRVLHQLHAERLVSRHPELRRWRLGPLAFELGIASAPIYDLRGLCEDTLEALARDTGDSAYLMLRSGLDAVCVDQRDGDYPMRALALEVGSRRPLGTGAGGLAILAALRGEERQEIVRQLASEAALDGPAVASALARACDDTADADFVVVDGGIYRGVTAMACPFRDLAGEPAGALIVAALSRRMTPARVRSTGAALRAACAEVEGRLRTLRQAAWRHA